MIQKPCTNLNHKCNLLRRTLQVKNSKISYKKLHRKISVFESLGLQIYKKETLIQVLSCQIYKISKNTFFNSYSGCFRGLTPAFKVARDKNRCDCLQYKPDLAEKDICRRKNPEAATVSVL